ncbi:MAG: hypothetical protein M3O80_07900, partial [Chloroflexota bacterium]|nr:hypothetical protein [Chloroflexota bacterium]
ADRLTRLVGATLGSSSDSDERDRDQLFEAWRVLIQALSRQARMIVVFEDLHWASDSLLDLVDHVTLPRADAPLVMVALARPELLDRRPNWGGGRRNFTSLGLEPLSAAESLQLVGLLTEGLPDAMAKRIVERSGGNPFFTGELVRAYQERKRAGADDAEIVLPDTVHATVLARLDALPEEERRVLEYAAVTGRTARAAAVGALLPDLSPTKIDAALEALADRDLLVAQGPGTYTFRHIVIREVAYATLPRAERVRAHLHLPAWLESYGAEHGEEMAELVAYHYRQAIALSPGGKPPEGLAIDKVVAALERAARVAWTGGAYTEAREQILEAIRLSRPEDHLHLYELLGDVMRFGDVGIEGYRQALAQWESLPDADPRVAARLLVKQLSVIGRWSGSISKYVPQEEVVALETRARALLARAPDPDLTARLACCAAFMVMRYEFDQASIPDVKRNVQAAYDFFAAKGDHDGQSAALDAIASVYRDADGDYVAAIAATQTRLRNAANLDLLERLDAWSVLAWDLVHLGRYDEAVALYDEAARNLRPGETVASLSHVASWSVYAALLSGAWDDVLRLVDGLVERREEGHQVLGRYTTMAWVSGMRVAAARLDATRVARYRSSLIANADLAALTPSAPLYPLFRALLEGDDDAAVAYLNGPVGQPERRAELISSLVFERGSSVPEATLATLEARLPPPPPLLRLRIQLARAVSGSDAALRQAIADLDEGGLIGEAARAAALLAMRTHDPADRSEAERRLSALGDQLFLQRLREGS